MVKIIGKERGKHLSKKHKNNISKSIREYYKRNKSKNIGVKRSDDLEE
jgi:hypothetical protein